MRDSMATPLGASNPPLSFLHPAAWSGGGWSPVLAQATLAQAKDPASALVSGPETGVAGSTTQPATPVTPGAQPSAGPGLGIFLLPIAVLVVFTFLMGNPQRKEKKRQSLLLAGLRKQDKVLTIGGMIGTVVDIRDDEVVLKIDENANTRVRFTKNSIQQVLKQGDGPSNGAALSASEPKPEPKVEVRTGKGEKAAV